MAKVSLEKTRLSFYWLKVCIKSGGESRAAGYTNIEFHKGALDGEELKASIRDAHFIGLRSRTHLTERSSPPRKTGGGRLFCIGTNR